MGYTTGAKEIDKFVYEHQEMVICFAAGNHGEEPVRRAAKNCITVGASRSSRDPMDPNPDAVANFSSRGPVKNRRHKPDVVAPGTCILSANSGMVQTPANPGPDNHWCYKERDKYGHTACRRLCGRPPRSPHQPLSHMSTTIPKRCSSTAPTFWGLPLPTSCPATSQDMAASILPTLLRSCTASLEQAFARKR